MPDLVREFLPASLKDRPHQLAFVAFAGCVSSVLVSIAASEFLLAAALAGGLWLVYRSRASRPLPPILWPLSCFFIWTIIAALKSPDVPLALTITKKFYLAFVLLLVPLVARGARQVRAVYHWIFALSFVSALAGLIQFTADPHRDLLHRISGFMSQWMTYSGLLMLVLVALAAYAVCFASRRRLWILPLGVALVAALYLSETRNAWLGAIMGLATVFALTRPKALAGLVGTMVILYLLSPAAMQQRLRTAWDTGDPNTQNRIELFQTSVRIIRDNPWFGVGPKNVGHEALRYRGKNDFPDWMYQHMHNNLLQIAAERGIPGLILWIWFMGQLAWDAFRLFCHTKSRGEIESSEGREALMASVAALGGSVALLLAGMFEYNFGDSEILTLFLFMAGAPYAYSAGADDAKLLKNSVKLRKRSIKTALSVK